MGFLAFVRLHAKYTSQSLILVEGQKVPESMVQPVVSEDLTARMATLQQQVLSQSNLQPVVERVFPGKNSQQQGEIIDTIRLNMQLEPVVTDLSQIGQEEAGVAEQSGAGFLRELHGPEPARSAADLHRTDFASCGREPQINSGGGERHQ